MQASVAIDQNFVLSYVSKGRLKQEYKLVRRILPFCKQLLIMV